MKSKNVSKASALTFVLAAFLVGCSGNNKSASDEQGAESPTADAMVAEVTTPEVKVFDHVDASVQSQLNVFLTDYFSLNQSLIDDNQDGAKAAAKTLSITIAKFDMSKLAGDQMDFYHTQLAKLQQGLKDIDASADIEETRMALVLVSEGMYALAKAYHPNESELYYQFCPMAKNGDGANWLSNTKEIINPYMGQRMLKCGRTQETLAKI